MSSEYTDYYKVLGFDEPTDDFYTLRAAFRRLSRLYHPDINPDHNDGVKFKEINEAWEILQNEKKRRSYDLLWYNRFGRTALTGTPTPEPPRQETSRQPSAPRADSTPPPPRGEPNENRGSVFKSVDDLLAFAGLSQRYQELFQFDSINRIAVEETLPLLNVIFQAASLWLAKDTQTNPNKEGTNTAIRVNMARFLERLTESEYLMGKPMNVDYPDSETARLIAVCCAHIQKKNCSISYTRKLGVITISFSAHRLFHAYEGKTLDGELPPWENSKNTYRWFLSQANASIYSILQVKGYLFRQTQFLRESSSESTRTPGLVDPYSIWLMKNNIPELTLKNDNLIMNAIEKCLDYFADTESLTLKKINTHVNEVFYSLAEQVQAPNLLLIQQAVIRSLSEEYQIYMDLNHSRAPLPEILQNLKKLEGMNCPLRKIETFTDDPTGSQNQLSSQVTSWEQVRNVFEEITHLDGIITTIPLLHWVDIAHSLPRFLQLRKLYLFYCLKNTNQLNDYLKHYRSFYLPFSKENKKWNDFNRLLSSLGWGYDFTQFCLDRD